MSKGTNSFSLEELKKVIDHDENSDLESNLEEYHEIMDTLAYLNQAMAEENQYGYRWKVESNFFIFKIILHANSLYTLLNKTKIRSNYYPVDMPIIDMVSILTLLRTQLEAVLTHKFIYILPHLDDEKAFRYSVWSYSALKQLSEIARESDFENENTQKNDSDLEKLKTSITDSIHFKSLATNIQKQVLAGKLPRMAKNGDSKKRSWNDLIGECKFGNLFFDDSLYKILSGSSHSEGVIKLFMKQECIEYKSNNHHAKMMLFISKLLLSVTIIDRMILYPTCSKKFEKVPTELQEKIAKLSAIAYSNFATQNRSKS